MPIAEQGFTVLFGFDLARGLLCGALNVAQSRPSYSAAYLNADPWVLCTLSPLGSAGGIKLLM